MIPQITWWNGTLELTDTQKWRIAHENGTGSAKSRMALTLSRADLGRKLTCEVNRDGRKSEFNYSLIKSSLINTQLCKILCKRFRN